MGRSADAEPEADAYYGVYGYGGYGLGYAGYADYGYPAYSAYSGLYHGAYAAPHLGYYGKRSADAEPEADAYYGAYGYGGYGYGGYRGYASPYFGGYRGYYYG